MAYVFYNTTTEDIIAGFRQRRYTVDGQNVIQNPSILPDDWLELEVVYDENRPSLGENEAYQSSWQRVGDNWVETITTRPLTAEEISRRREAAVPNAITRCQFFKALYQVLGKEKNEIVTIINNIANTNVKRQRLLELQDEYYIRRDSDFVAYIQNYFGYSDLQIDNFFTTAATL